MKEKFEVDRYEENKATYLGIEIEKVSNAEFGGIILDSANYEGEINHIGISHERTRHPDEALTEADHAICDRN